MNLSKLISTFLIIIIVIFLLRNFVKLMNKNDPFIKYLNFTFFYIALLKKYFSFFKSRKNLVCYNMRIMKLIWKKSGIKSTCSI